MKTINSVIGIAVVAIVGYFALKYLAVAAQSLQSQTAIRTAGGGGGGGSSAGGSLGQLLSGLFGKGNGNLLSDSQFQADLTQLLDQSNQQVDAGLNDVFIPSVPTQPLDLNQFAFPLDLSGGGAGGSDTSMLQTSYDDSSWQVS